MKKILIVLSLALSTVCLPLTSTAQNVSQNIRYQAVLRDARGYVRANQSLFVTLKLEGNDGTVYEETLNTVTDALGQINVWLGTGTPADGSDYSAVDWSQAMTLKVYNDAELLASMPVSSVPSANYSAKAQSALTARYAATASSLQDKTFDDEADTGSSNYYSSAKIARMMRGASQSQTGQTALARETAARISEDARILDSLTQERTLRTDYDAFLLDSISKVAAATDSGVIEIWQKIMDTIILVADHSGDELNGLRETVRDTITLLTEEWGNDLNELREALRDTITLLAGELEEDMESLWTALNKEKTDRGTADNLLSDRIADSVQRIWDSLARIKKEVTNVNFCETGDPEHGIYTNAIPVYSETAHIGLFTTPELKILSQSDNNYLFSDMDKHTSLDRSFKTRILTYNESGNIQKPTEVYIPAGSGSLQVYVDNKLLESDKTYYTYDILVFEVEYYKVAPERGIMYVTLVRE